MKEFKAIATFVTGCATWLVAFLLFVLLMESPVGWELFPTADDVATAFNVFWAFTILYVIALVALLGIQL